MNGHALSTRRVAGAGGAQRGRLRRDLRGIYTIWYRDVLRFFKDRMRIFASLGQPLLFLFVFGAGISAAVGRLGGASGGIDFKQFIFPGVMGMTVLFSAVFSALSIVWDREFGFLREVLVAPISRWAVVFGKVAGGSTIAMFQAALLLLLAPLIGVRFTVLQVIELFGVMLLLAAMMSAFGILIASRQRTMEGFQVVMQFLLFPMLFLSGAFFPLTTNVPGWLLALARIDPVTYGVDLLRQVALREALPGPALAALSLHPAGFDVAVMVVLTFVFLAPAVWLFAKQE